jgi:hypothetical protein
LNARLKAASDDKKKVVMRYEGEAMPSAVRYERKVSRLQHPRIGAFHLQPAPPRRDLHIESMPAIGGL